jgi:methionine--tRNA ligase beta chain
VQNVKIPFVDFGIVDPVPVFFYGDDDDGATATSADSSCSAPVPAGDKVEAAAPAGKDAGGKKELTEEEKKATADKRAKKAAEKKAKKGTQSNTGGKTGGGDGVSPAAELNVSALDIRVGKIIDVWEHEGSEKLWCEKIDLGEAEPRQILSGLRAFYKKEEIQDRYVLVLCNLKKRNLVGVPSHGMVLCASNADHTAVEFVIPPEGVKVGERVAFDGFAGEPESENKVAKKKILEKLAPDLKTNNDGVVVWKGIKCETSAGPCVASKGMKDAQVS